LRMQSGHDAITAEGNYAIGTEANQSCSAAYNTCAGAACSCSQ
jgi:hypothetical protein